MECARFEFLVGFRHSFSINFPWRILQGAFCGSELHWLARLITGVAEGAGNLTVHSASGEDMFALRVVSRTATPTLASAFVPGWGDPVKFFAGNYDMQPKYAQLEDDDWCPRVGCGPNAWAIVLAWFDRNFSVKAAFGNLATVDAPADSYGTSNRQKLMPVLRELHEQCDVICPPFSDQGATAPGDMEEGGLGYTYIAKLAGLLTRQWRIGWTLGDDCPEDGALRCRDAVKKGYPAAVGLGWLWHYAVSYGYAYQHYYLAPDTIYMTKRFLKCNMGWGIPIRSGITFVIHSGIQTLVSGTACSLSKKKAPDCSGADGRFI